MEEKKLHERLMGWADGNASPYTVAEKLGADVSFYDNGQVAFCKALKAISMEIEREYDSRMWYKTGGYVTFSTCDEVFSGDGKQLHVGDEVWLKPGSYSSVGSILLGISSSVHSTQKYVVKSIRDNKAYFDSGDFCPVSWLTHIEPDGEDRINEDARKSFTQYWGCEDTACISCPSKIDGELPREHYGTGFCDAAMRLDLLRRQRELDKRSA